MGYGVSSGGGPTGARLSSLLSELLKHAEVLYDSTGKQKGH